MKRQRKERGMTAAYVRVSTEEQQLGVEAQKTAIARWCSQHGQPVDLWAEDVGVSGSVRPGERPELARVIEALGPGDTLIVARRDRLARDFDDVVALHKLARDNGWMIQSVDGVSVVDNDPLRTLHARIVDAYAEFERGMLRSRTRAALAERRAKGQRVSGHAPYGSKFDAGRVVANESELAMIALAKSLRAQGLTLAGVAGELTGRGFLTRSGKPYTFRSVYRLFQRTAQEQTQEGATETQPEFAQPDGRANQPANLANL